MKHFTYRDYWSAPVRDAIRLLEFSLLIGEKMHTSKLRVEQARDQLGEVIHVMLQNGDVENKAPIYTDLFEACSFLTATLVSRPFAFTLVREAIARLRTVRDLEVRS